MNKILLLIAGALLILMTTTSPALIRSMFDTNAFLAILIWFSPLVLLFAMYHFYRNYPSVTFHEPGMIGSKGGRAAQTNNEEKDDLEQAIEANDIKDNGDKFRK